MGRMIENEVLVKRDYPGEDRSGAGRTKWSAAEILAPEMHEP